MQTIIIRLNPRKLVNPDLDLRCLLPERVEKISNGAIQDNGYEYLDDQTLGIWLQAESAKRAYPLVIKLLQEEKFLENDLSLSAEIYISEMETADIEKCAMVFPK